MNPMKKFVLFLFVFGVCGPVLMAQGGSKDRAVYKQYPESYYWGTIMTSLQGDKVDKPERKPSFKVDIEGRKFPNDPKKYEKKHQLKNPEEYYLFFQHP